MPNLNSEKYHSCKYERHGMKSNYGMLTNMGRPSSSGHCVWHGDGIRIYIRSKEKDRKFIAIGWYCTSCKMFELDEVLDKDYERKFRLENNMKPEDSYGDRLNEVARMMGISV